MEPHILTPDKKAHSWVNKLTIRATDPIPAMAPWAYEWAAPYYGYNTAIRLHVMHEGLLWNMYRCRLNYSGMGSVAHTTRSHSPNDVLRLHASWGGCDGKSDGRRSKAFEWLRR